MQKINEIVMVEGRGFDSNVYAFEDVLVDTGTGANINYILESLGQGGINPADLSLIVNTHNHYDHVGGNRFLDLKVAMHQEDAESLEKGMILLQQPGCSETLWERCRWTGNSRRGITSTILKFCTPRDIPVGYMSL